MTTAYSQANIMCMCSVAPSRQYVAIPRRRTSPCLSHRRWFDTASRPARLSANTSIDSTS